MSSAPSAKAPVVSSDAPLSIAYLTYRGKPHVGGQGVYTRHLTKALVDLGHRVEVFGGQPYPVLDERITLHELPSLDLWNDHFPGRFPGYWELKTKADWAEAFSHLRGTFGEPLAFSMRALQALEQAPIRLRPRSRQPVPRVQRSRHREDHPHHRHAASPDHPRPCAGDGPHHNVAKALLDRSLVQLRKDAGSCGQSVAAHRRGQRELASKTSMPTWESASIACVSFRWASTPSCSLRCRRSRVAPGRLITTASADVALKGLSYLLEAMAKLRTERDVTLTIIGKPRDGASNQLIDQLGLRPHIDFVSGVPDERIVELYAEAELAVVPSLYEGFSLPAIEAMSTGICLVATDGGALPEVTGRDGETVLQCRAGDVDDLASAIRRGLDDAELRARIGEAGRQRVVERWSWRHCAQLTVEQYREVLAMPQNVDKLRRNGRP